MSDADLHAEYRRVLADRQAHNAAHAAWCERRDRIKAAAYDALPAADRAHVLGETERSYSASLRRGDGTLAVDHDSAEFRQRLRECAWRTMVAGGKRSSERYAVPAFEPPPRTARLLPDRVEPEVRRRACAGFTYLTPDGRRPRDPSRAVRATETQLMEEWLTAEET